MADASILIQKPSAQTTQLVLLFHGVGATPADLAGIGRLIAARDPGAFVVSVAAPFACDFGQGLQWFSVVGVSEGNRLARVEAARPVFVETVQAWQEEAQVGPEATTLIGFSQGSIMSMSAAAQAGSALAARVIAVAGRFAQLPESVAPGVSYHLVHGDADPVIGVEHGRAAAARLRELGAPVTLDVVPGLAHGIDERALAHLLRYQAEALG